MNYKKILFVYLGKYGTYENTKSVWCTLEGWRNILRRHENHQGLSKISWDMLKYKTVVRVHYNEKWLPCKRVQISRIQTATGTKKKKTYSTASFDSQLPL